jgi:molybdopterin synthase catalytic subunit
VVQTSRSCVEHFEWHNPERVTHKTHELRGNGLWVQITTHKLIVDDALSWASRSDCGAIVLFVGTVRDHSDGRPGVESLEYEVYIEGALDRLAKLAAAARVKWPMIRGLVLHHRAGCLFVGDIGVLVAVSSPHRSEAFDAAEFCIDTLKKTVPIWKKETWSEGTDWSECGHELAEIEW